MKKNFKTVKTALILGALLGSLFVIMIPSNTFAAETEEIKPTSGLASYLKINWTATSEPIIPIDDLRYYSIKIDYSVTLGPLGRLLLPFILGRQVDIKLDIVNSNPWCQANLAFGTITTQVQRQGIIDSQNTQISIELDKDAPAYGSGFVTIRAKVPKVGLIAGFEQDFTLKFKPAYLALIQFDLPGTNTKTIGPMDTAVFPIKINNLGNARTSVRLKVEQKPADWLAVVTDEVLVDVDGSATAYLTIRPPKGMGYHDDDGAFQISMTPHRAENPNVDIGTPTDITVIVESRGFSTIGIEGVLPVIIVIIVILFFVYWFIKKQINK